MGLESPSKNITYFLFYVRVLKHQAAYMQEKASQECLEYLEQLSAKIDSKYKLFCQMELAVCKSMENVWRDFEQYYNWSSKIKWSSLSLWHLDCL